MNATPPGLRTARIIAADAREGDLLHHDDGWWPIAAVSPHGLMVEIKCAELLEVVRHHRSTPILVRWQVPHTTTGLAHHHRPRTRRQEVAMHLFNGHTPETAQLVVACLYEGDSTALQAATDACADSATANYLAELQTQAETWLARREET